MSGRFAVGTRLRSLGLRSVFTTWVAGSFHLTHVARVAMLVTHIRSIAMIGYLPRVIIILSITTISRSLRVVLRCNRIYLTSIIFHFRFTGLWIRSASLALFHSNSSSSSGRFGRCWIRNLPRSWSKLVGFHRLLLFSIHRSFVELQHFFHIVSVHQSQKR